MLAPRELMSVQVLQDDPMDATAVANRAAQRHRFCLPSNQGFVTFSRPAHGCFLDTRFLSIFRYYRSKWGRS